MKWDCDKRYDRLTSWHIWFAWYPVKIKKNDCRWLERVLRRGTLQKYNPHWRWEYKELRE